MGQTWLDVLFAHWPVPVARMRALVPSALELDTFDDRAWVSVTPFDVVGAHPRGLPPVLPASRFAELNVRTYVAVGGEPGIFFFSLDAASALAVAGARALYRLPYFRARMRIERDVGAVDYVSERDDPRGPAAGLHARWHPAGAARPPAPGSLDAWLVERYRLYAVASRRVLAADIHHAPWPLQAADAEVHAERMLAPLGLEPEQAPVTHCAARQDVVIWPPRPVGLKLAGRRASRTKRMTSRVALRPQGLRSGSGGPAPGQP